MVYAPLGIINLAVVVAIARETIIEGFEASYRSRRDQLAQKARERKELIRKKQSAARERRRRAAEELGQHGEGLHSGVNDDGGPRQAESAPVFVPPPSRSALVAGLGTSMPVAGAMAGTEARHHQLPTLNALERVKSGNAYKPRIVQLIRASARWISRPIVACVSARRHPSPDCEAAQPPDQAQPLEPGPGALQRTATFSSTTTTTSVDQSFVSLRQQLRREQQQEFRIKLTIAVTQFLIFWLVSGLRPAVPEAREPVPRT